MIEFIQDYIATFDFLKVCVLVGTLAGFVVMWFQVTEHIALWYFNIISAGALAINFFATEIYAYAAFQIYYIVTSAYGIYSWTKGKKSDDGEMKIQRMRGQWWLMTAVAMAVLIVVMYFILSKTGSEIALIDAIITSASVVATFLLTKKILEYWYLWIFADSLYILTVLYLGDTTGDKTLYPTVILYFCYIVTAVIGIVVWRKKYKKQIALETNENE